MIEKIFLLLILFQLKHFFADYLFQCKYMLGKFKNKGWIKPLFAHVFVHACFTFVIALYFSNFYLAILCVLTDSIIHFTMDRIKASPKMLGRFKIDQKQFWWSLGFDQMIHHLTHYLLIAIILFL